MAYLPCNLAVTRFAERHHETWLQKRYVSIILLNADCVSITHGLIWPAHRQRPFFSHFLGALPGNGALKTIQEAPFQETSQAFLATPPTLAQLPTNVYSFVWARTWRRPCDFYGDERCERRETRLGKLFLWRQYILARWRRLWSQPHWRQHTRRRYAFITRWWNIQR